MIPLDLRELKYVLTIVEEKSFSKAAKKLYIAQPSLSQFILRLEKSLGAPLFDRSKKPLSLTEEGEMYVDYATRILGMSDEMRRSFKDRSTIGKGRISLGVPLFRGVYLLPLLLPFFRKNHPNIEITLMEGDTNYLERMLLDGAIDICVMSLPIRARGIRYETVFDERILLAVPSGREESIKARRYKNAMFPVADIASLQNEDFILTNSGSRLRSIVESICLDRGINPRVVLETESLDTAQSLVGMGHEFTFVPEMYIRTAGDRPCPAYFSLQSPDCVWPMVVACKEGGHMSRLAKALFEETLEFGARYLREAIGGRGNFREH